MKKRGGFAPLLGLFRREQQACPEELMATYPDIQTWVQIRDAPTCLNTLD